MSKKNSLFKNETLNHSLLWFGAAVSIAEILTGVLFAPLGMAKGIAAILVGHLIGFLLLYFTGLIGAQEKQVAMETVKISFGQKGAHFFSALNILQLVGWTAVMIIGGARATALIAQNSPTLWCFIIGALILVWVLVGIKNMAKINVFAVGALFVLTVILSTVVFDGGQTLATGGKISFGAAVELSVAMPLSWLPLISDYTSQAQKGKQTSFAGAFTYTLGSVWMYIIGLGAAVFTGVSDIAQIMVQAGLGVLGLLIVVFSTVTTTFLDVYSAGICCNNILPKVDAKKAACVICVLGALIAAFTPIEQYENFLYLIGSVFAPMVAILLADYFLLHRRPGQINFDWLNFLLWLIGFVLYRLFMQIDTPIGNTLPVMLILMALVFICRKVKPANK